jgi:hypothetical protein
MLLSHCFPGSGAAAMLLVTTIKGGFGFADP